MASGASRPLFWATAGGVVAGDIVTKILAVATLTHLPLRLVGDWLRFRLVYNPGAAFGISAGPYSRSVFTVLALVALGVLWGMVRQTGPDQRIRLTALGLVCGGAIGNLIDRVRSPLGVVDFIDVGLGPYLPPWPTFNVADMAVTCGAIALAAVLWHEGRHIAPAVQAEAPPQAGPAELSS
jgi:signal peptidase II